MKPGGIWVFAEQRDRKLLKVTREVLSEGRRLADRCNGELIAVLLGYRSDGLVEEVGRHGADKVLLIDNPSLERYSTLPFCGVLAPLIQRHEPIAVIFGATSTANDLAPRLAARIKAGLVTNCNLVEITDDGTLEVTKPAYGGKISAIVSFSLNRLQLITISSGVMEIATAARKPEVVNIETGKVDDPIVKHLGLLKAEPESVDLSEAELIVAGGRGLGSQEGFRMLGELAKLLRASLGGTRVAVDNGWIPYERQIGQTGKTVSPRFFMTLGTSGAIQYTMGFKDSEFIMALDTNPRAIIFEVADIGVVADVQRVLPQLITLLKNYQPSPNAASLE